MSKSSKLERTNVVHTIRDMEQFKEEYKKLGENYDYFVTDTLKKALNSKFHHRNIFYLAKEKVFVCVSEKTMKEKITELLNKYNYNGLGILRQNGD